MTMKIQLSQYRNLVWAFRYGNRRAAAILHSLAMWRTQANQYGTRNAGWQAAVKACNEF